MIDMRDTRPASADISGKRVGSYDAYMEARRHEAEGHRAELDAAAKRYTEAAAE